MINIFVIALGNSGYKEDALYVIRDYFSRYDVNLVILEEDDPTINYKNAHPSWLRLLHHKYIKNDLFTLSWDLDILPTENSIQILNHIDYDKINMCIDNSIILTHSDYTKSPYYQNKITPNFKYNAGLIGIPYRYRQFCEKIYNDHAPGSFPSWEQYYFNDELQNQNINVNILPYVFNGMYPPPNIDPTFFTNAVNKHYTWGVMGKDKIPAIKNHRLTYDRIVKGIKNV